MYIEEEKKKLRHYIVSIHRIFYSTLMLVFTYHLDTIHLLMKPHEMETEQSDVMPRSKENVRQLIRSE